MEASPKQQNVVNEQARGLAAAMLPYLQTANGTGQKPPDESEQLIEDSMKILGKALKARAAKAAVRQLEEPDDISSAEPSPEPPKGLNVNELILESLKRADKAVGERFTAEEKALQLQHENKKAELDFTSTVMKEVLQLIREQKQEKAQPQPSSPGWQSFLPQEVVHELAGTFARLIAQSLTPRSPREELLGALQMLQELQKVMPQPSTNGVDAHAIIKAKELDLKMKEIDADLERYKENLRREEEERAKRGERIDRLIESIGQLALGVLGPMLSRGRTGSEFPPVQDVYSNGVMGGEVGETTEPTNGAAEI